jgi:hypothetical protein
MRTTKMINIDTLRTDGGTQPRAALTQSAIERYADLLRADTAFEMPPVEVVEDADGNRWLVDGYHRREAYLIAGRKRIPATVVPGTLRDAILRSLAANTMHGLPARRKDRRRAVERMLKDAEWSQWSDRTIAKHCGVSPSTVGSLRRRLSVQFGQIDARLVGRAGSMYRMDTAPIGRLPGADQADQARPKEDGPQGTNAEPPPAAGAEPAGCPAGTGDAGPSVVCDDAGTPVPERLTPIFSAKGLFGSTRKACTQAANRLAELEATQAYREACRFVGREVASLNMTQLRDALIQAAQSTLPDEDFIYRVRTLLAPRNTRELFSSNFRTATVHLRDTRPSRVCPDCEGVEGSMENDPCRHCNGKGFLIFAETQHERSLPAGAAV